MSVFNNVSKYLPHTTVRSINKQLYHKNVEYCELAKNIYNDDMKLYTNKNNTIIYGSNIHRFIINSKKLNFVPPTYTEHPSVVRAEINSTAYKKILFVYIFIYQVYHTKIITPQFSTHLSHEMLLRFDAWRDLSHLPKIYPAL